MSKSKTKSEVKQSQQIEILPIGELQVEPGFNIRDEKTFSDNVKQLSQHIKAHGGIDASMHVVQYVDRDGKKMIRGGHTLHASAKLLGYKEVPAIKCEMDSTQEIVNLITSNTGAPLSQKEQGIAYIRLRDGGEGRGGLAMKEISSLVGYTMQHISNCILLNEQPENIAKLIIEGNFSSNAFILAQKAVKNDSDLEKIMIAAKAEADKEGKTTVTEKHVKAIKDQFVKPARLKSAVKDAPDSMESLGSSEPTKDADEDQSNPNFNAPEDEPLVEISKPKKKVDKQEEREKMINLLDTFFEGRGIAILDEDISELVSFILSSVVPF